jgi:hypothetical protein
MRTQSINEERLLHIIPGTDRRCVLLQLRIHLVLLLYDQGKVGKVLRSGNGWVQLMTSVGEMAKRAYELELIAADSVSYHRGSLVTVYHHKLSTLDLCYCQLCKC